MTKARPGILIPVAAAILLTAFTVGFALLGEDDGPDIPAAEGVVHAPRGAEQAAPATDDAPVTDEDAVSDAAATPVEPIVPEVEEALAAALAGDDAPAQADLAVLVEQVRDGTLTPARLTAAIHATGDSQADQMALARVALQADTPEGVEALRMMLETNARDDAFLAGLMGEIARAETTSLDVLDVARGLSHHGASHVRDAARLALGSYPARLAGADARTLGQAMMAAWEERPERTIDAAAQAALASTVGEADRARTAVHFAGSDDVTVRMQAAEDLATGDADAGAALADLATGDPEPNVRSVAAESLAQRADAPAAAGLAAALGSDDHTANRTRIVVLLQDMIGHDDIIRPALERAAAEDNDATTRKAAATALLVRADRRDAEQAVTGDNR